MVFAVWAARPGLVTPEVTQAFQESCRFGRDHIEEIIAAESARRGFAPEMVRKYLTRHIVHELGPREYQGLEQFLTWSRQPQPSGASAGRASSV
jgi:predicted solute-binding protein